MATATTTHSGGEDDDDHEVEDDYVDIKDDGQDNSRHNTEIGPIIDKPYTLKCAVDICRNFFEKHFFRSSNFAHDSWKRKLARSQVAIVVVVVIHSLHNPVPCISLSPSHKHT